MKFTPEYIRGFVEVCDAVGLSEKQASQLLEVAATHQDFKDDAFRKGFLEAMEKHAYRDDMFMPDLQGAFSAPNDSVAKGVKGFGLGGLAGGGLALASILRPSIGHGAGGKGLLMKLNPNGKGFLNSGAIGRMSHQVPDMRALGRVLKNHAPTGGTFGVPMKNKMESRIGYGIRRLMGSNNKRLAAGVGVGGLGGAAANIKYDITSGYGNSVPALDHWLPDNMSASGVPGMGGQQQYPGGDSSISRNPSSPYDPVGSFHVVPPPGGAMQGGMPSPSASPFDQKINELRSQMDNSGTIAGALNNNRIRKQMAQLESERTRMSSDNAIFGGGRRSELAHAGQSIADKLYEVERAIKQRESRAGNAAAWLERSGGPTTVGNLIPQAWNKLVGNEAGAQQISAELQQLYKARETLNQQLQTAGQTTR